MKTYLKQNGDRSAARRSRSSTGHDRPRAGHRQAARAGARHARQRRHPRRLRADARTRWRWRRSPTEAKKPMVIMNAATSIITTSSPYIVRVSHTLPQDYAADGAMGGEERHQARVHAGLRLRPGHRRRGGVHQGVQGSRRRDRRQRAHRRCKNPDFAPFLQRIKDAKPEAVFVFLPAGEQTIAFIKGYEERGLAEPASSSSPPATSPTTACCEAMGDPTLGLITSFHYSAAHDSPENKAFLKAYAEANGTKLRPNFMAVAGYDGMAAISEALKKTGGSIDADKFVAALKGMRLDEPARPDHDRPRDPRHRADRLHPPGREGQRRALQRRVRQVPRPEGSGQVRRRAAGARAPKDAVQGPGRIARRSLRRVRAEWHCAAGIAIWRNAMAALIHRSCSMASRTAACCS